MLFQLMVVLLSGPSLATVARLVAREGKLAPVNVQILCHQEVERDAKENTYNP